MVEKYYIANKKGEGLHYICGSLFWYKPDNVEAIENFTSFDSGELAAAFALERNIPGPVNIRRVSYQIS